MMSMDPKDFDEILKQKLGELKDSPIPAPDWSRMERDLDSHKDQVFDEQIKRKLEQLDVSRYSKSNWNNLYDLINTRILRKRAVLKSKALELSVLCLLLFTISNMGWLKPEDKTLYAVAKTPKLIVNEKPTNTIIALVDENSVQDSEVNPVTTAHEIIESTNDNLIVEEIVEQESSFEDVALVQNIAVAELQSSTTPDFSSEITLMPQPIGEDNERLTTESSLFALNDSGIKGHHIDDIVSHSFAEARMIDELLGNPELIQDPLAINQEIKLPIITPSSTNSKPKYYLEAGVDLTYNEIESALRTVSSRNLVATKSSTNVLYPTVFVESGIELPKLTLSTGVEYQKFSYNPVFSHISGQLSDILTQTEIKELEYNVVSVPVSVSWDLLNYKDWALKLNTGIVSNFITNLSITAKQTLRSGSRITHVNSNEIDYSDIPVALNSGFFDEPINESGTGRSSYYFQSRTGFQISKKLNAQTSIIANMDYNYQLPISVSDIQDTINSYSIGLSVRRFIG